MFASIKAQYDRNNYPIYISDNLSSNLRAFLNNYDRSSIFIIADSYFSNKSNIPDIDLFEIFESYNHLFLNGGIESKNISNVLEICKKIQENKLNKDGCIVAIGGGVIGDLSALTASIYKRGINLAFILQLSFKYISSNKVSNS